MDYLDALAQGVQACLTDPMELRVDLHAELMDEETLDLLESHPAVGSIKLKRTFNRVLVGDRRFALLWNGERSKVTGAALQLLVRRLRRQPHPHRPSMNTPTKPITVCLLTDDLPVQMRHLVFDSHLFDVCIDSSTISQELLSAVSSARQHPDFGSITYRPELNRPTTVRTSTLRPNNVIIYFIEEQVPEATARTVLNSFVDEPQHIFDAIYVFPRSPTTVFLNLPAVRSRLVDIQMPIELAPGSKVHRLVYQQSSMPKPSAEPIRARNCCYTIELDTPSLGFITQFAADTCCTHLKLGRNLTDIRLIYHPMTAHVRLLDLNISILNNNSEHLLLDLVSKFPRLVLARFWDRDVVINRLLKFVTICQREPQLLDYGMLLPDQHLQPVLCGLFAIHSGVILSDTYNGLPDTVSAALLKAMLLMS
eukprot:TRINITY_DN5544_c0_g1_i1.p1 TRINITY_DN5544_c0_g1~~TRINITY_DN5544_c0_g1_i1.p1  ORF type:complete len:423 (+),score=24.44 TRINITY_DN5544_c0_g1_i1:251-1519(+)